MRSKAFRHADSDLEVSDDIVLGFLVVERVQQDLVTIACIDSVGDVSDDSKECIGKIFVEVRLKSSAVQDV